MAGRRFGKTLLALAKLIQASAKPNSLNWLVAPTLKQAKQIAWRELLKIFPSKAIEKINETELYIQVNGINSRIEVKGADYEEGLLGAALDYLIVEEAQDIKPHVWSEILRPMLIGREGKAMIIGTKRPNNWFRSLWLKSNRGEMGSDYKSIYYPSMANSTISQEEWSKAKAEVSDYVWQREFISDPLTEDGAEAGIMYTEFNYDTHVVRPIKIGNDWPVFRSIDWGVEHPTVCLWAAISPDKKVYVFDEYGASGLTVDRHAQIIRGKTKHPIVTTVIDPSTSRREGPMLRTIAQEFNLNGIPVIPGQRENKDNFGVNCVKKFLKDGNGHVNVFFFNTPRLIEQLSTLCWEDVVNDDFTDALRYLLVFLNDYSLHVHEARSGNQENQSDPGFYQDQEGKWRYRLSSDREPKNFSWEERY